MLTPIFIVQDLPESRFSVLIANTRKGSIMPGGIVNCIREHLSKGDFKTSWDGSEKQETPNPPAFNDPLFATYLKSERMSNTFHSIHSSDETKLIM